MVELKRKIEKQGSKIVIETQSKYTKQELLKELVKIMQAINTNNKQIESIQKQIEQQKQLIQKIKENNKELIELKREIEKHYTQREIEKARKEWTNKHH